MQAPTLEVPVQGELMWGRRHNELGPFLAAVSSQVLLPGTLSKVHFATIDLQLKARAQLHPFGHSPIRTFYKLTHSLGDTFSQRFYFIQFLT